jgi:large subunit ribosomal protein L32
MAVPKKRTSKSKRRSRLAKWSQKATLQAKRALSLAKSLENVANTSFVYSVSNADSQNLEEK